MMKLKRFSAAILVIALCGASALLTGCASEPELEAVVTLGVPEDEKLAETIQDGDYVFNLYSTYAELAAYTGSDSDIIIPDTAGGLNVLTIGEKAFWGNTTLKSVKLPANLRTVDRYAFQKCTSLAAVEFNSVLETIGDYAFRETAIEKLDFPVSLVSIGKYTFADCIGFETLVIPDRVTSIGKYAFYGCTKMTSFTLNQRITRIQDHTFYNCTALTSAVISEYVTEIGEYAFAGCTSLQTIEIPATVTTVGEGQFHGTTSVTVITPAGSAAAKFCEKNNVKWQAPDK